MLIGVGQNRYSRIRHPLPIVPLAFYLWDHVSFSAMGVQPQEGEPIPFIRCQLQKPSFTGRTSKG